MEAFTTKSKKILFLGKVIKINNLDSGKIKQNNQKS